MLAPPSRPRHLETAAMSSSAGAACMNAAPTVGVGKCGVRRRCRCCRTTYMGCFGACLPAAREPQLESGRAASRHRRCCRGCIVRVMARALVVPAVVFVRHIFGYGRDGQASSVRLVAILCIELWRLARAASRVTRWNSRVGQVYIARQQRACWTYKDAW